MLNSVEKLRQVDVDAMCVSLPDDLLNPLSRLHERIGRGENRNLIRRNSGSKIGVRTRADGLLNESVELRLGFRATVSPPPSFGMVFPPHRSGASKFPPEAAAESRASVRDTNSRTARSSCRPDREHPGSSSTRRHACSRFRGSTTCVIKSASGETFRDGVSANAGSVTSGRRKFAGNVGSTSSPKSNVCCVAPRSKFVGRSSLFFMVRSFLSPLDCDETVQ